VNHLILKPKAVMRIVPRCECKKNGYGESAIILLSNRESFVRGKGCFRKEAQRGVPGLKKVVVFKREILGGELSALGKGGGYMLYSQMGRGMVGGGGGGGGGGHWEIRSRKEKIEMKKKGSNKWGGGGPMAKERSKNL